MTSRKKGSTSTILFCDSAFYTLRARKASGMFVSKKVGSTVFTICVMSSSGTLTLKRYSRLIGFSCVGSGR